jgi:hypothetical protein
MDSKDKKHIIIALISTVALTFVGNNYTDSYFESKVYNQKSETLKALIEVNHCYRMMIDKTTNNK